MASETVSSELKQKIEEYIKLIEYGLYNRIQQSVSKGCYGVIVCTVYYFPEIPQTKGMHYIESNIFYKNLTEGTLICSMIKKYFLEKYPNLKWNIVPSTSHPGTTYFYVNHNN